MITGLVLAAATFFYANPIAVGYSLDTNVAMVSGRVFGPRCVPISNATVTFASSRGTATTLTNAAGEYTIFALWPGIWNVTPAAPQYLGTSETADLRAGNHFEWDFTVTPSTITYVSARNAAGRCTPV